MNDQGIILAGKAEELLGVLEKEAGHIEWTVSKLDELRGFLIKRDEKGLKGLLEDIKTQQQVYSGVERRREDLREEISGLLGYSPQMLTLSVLMGHIGEPARLDSPDASRARRAKNAIAGAQRKLKSLVGDLQKAYAGTVTLMSECSRINSILLKIVFERGRSGLVCYDSAGQTPRQQDAAFMSTRI